MISSCKPCSYDNDATEFKLHTNVIPTKLMASQSTDAQSRCRCSTLQHLCVFYEKLYLWPIRDLSEIPYNNFLVGSIFRSLFEETTKNTKKNKTSFMSNISAHLFMAKFSGEN